jgi:transcriptional regulator, gntR family
MFMDMQIQALRTQMVEKKQASDTLYYTVREAIATGLLPMGTRLREEDLAEAFDVSRTPVREAMKKLEIERLVETSSTSGSIVRLLTVDECLDTLEVLELLRASACSMLLGRIPRALLMVLEQNTRRGTKLTDAAQQYENNIEFHELLVRATGNSVLAKLSEQLSFTERMINNTVLPVRYAADYAEHHRMLMKAIVDNDQEAVQRELEHSRQKVEEYMRRIVGAFLDAGGE